MRKRVNEFAGLILSCYLICWPASVWGQQYDGRINQAITVTLTNLGVTLKLTAVGRVGNWVATGNSQTIIFDVNNLDSVKNPNKVTALYTSTITPPISGSSLTLNAAPLITPGLANFSTLPTNTYQGNGWMCPGGVVLFQVSANPSNTGGYGPGAGADNNVWMLVNGGVYQLTTVTAGQGNGVLGPMCSNDSGSGVYHIVYGYRNAAPSNILPYVRTPDCNTVGMSDGMCGWYGDWSLVFADYSVGPTGGPTLIASASVKPRTLAQNPFAEIAPNTGSGTLGFTTCPVVGTCTTIMSSALRLPPLHHQ